MILGGMRPGAHVWNQENGFKPLIHEPFRPFA